VQNFAFKFQTVAEKTAKNIRELLYFAAPCTVILKPGLGVTQGHRKWYHSIRHPWLPINVP